MGHGAKKKVEKTLFLCRWIEGGRKLMLSQQLVVSRVLGSAHHVRGVPERNNVVFAAAQRGPGTGSPQRADEAREHILFTEAFNGQNQPAESHSHHGPLCCRNKVSKHNTSLLSLKRLGRVFHGETGERVQKMATAREVATVEKNEEAAKFKSSLKGAAPVSYHT